MSVEGVTKLKKYLDKPHPKPSAVQISTPAILSASKGGKLKLVKGENPARIKFWCKDGVTIPDEIEWVRRNLFGSVNHVYTAPSTYLCGWALAIQLRKTSKVT